MEGILDLISGHYDFVLLVFLRVSGLFINSPVFGRRNVPNPAKIGFCLILSLLFLMNLAAPAQTLVYDSLFGYLLLCLKELLLGLAMGFATTAMFNLVFTAGGIMDMQLSYSMAAVYDPQNSSPVPLTGRLMEIGLMVVFFAADGHLKLVQMLHETFRHLPVGQLSAPPELALVAVKVFIEAFVLGVMVAMPLVAAGFILEVCLGVMIRTMPQMNMFVVGIPLKIIVGLIITMFSLAVFINLSESIFGKMFGYIDEMFSLFVR